MTTFALLASPFLGPAVWAGVAEVLKRRGFSVLVPANAEVAPRRPQDVIDQFLAALPAEDSLILVPHSNAGLYVPRLMANLPVEASIFVDAIVPPLSGEIAVAPAALVEGLRSKVDASGLLPPWTHWWSEAQLAGLFPTGTIRAAVEGEQRPVPAGYLDQTVAVPGWDQQGCGYLAFGETYAVDRSEAERRGWPVETIPGRHLQMLHEPDRVADLIIDLARRAGGN